jgi:hypothetical protein
MSYERQNFTDGQKLKAEHLNKMDEALANPPIVVAKFYTEDFATLICESHTADEIGAYLSAGTPVVALVNDQSVPRYITCMCWMDDNAVYVGEPITDGGWSHYINNEGYYGDGDTSNKTIGNELWQEH